MVLSLSTLLDSYTTSKIASHFSTLAIYHLVDNNNNNNDNNANVNGDDGDVNDNAFDNDGNDDDNLW